MKRVQDDANYFSASLEVPFNLGPAAEFDENPESCVDGVKPFTRIDLVLLQLPIPDFTTTDAVYFAVPALAEELQHLRGLRRRECTLAFDEQMKELGEFAGKSLPDLVCFDVTGTYGQDDFAHLEGETDLLVSEAGLAVLRGYNLGGLSEIAPFRPGT